MDSLQFENYSKLGNISIEMEMETQTLGSYSASMRPLTFLVPLIFAIIFVLGIIGNGILIWIYVSEKSLRTVPNTHIFSLAVADILVTFSVPFTAIVYTTDSWSYGSTVCKFSEFVKDLAVGASVFTLVALSYDRYFAIAEPMKRFNTNSTGMTTYLTVIGIWIASILLALPTVVFSFVWKTHDQHTHFVFYICYPYPFELTDVYPKVVVAAKLVIYFAIPLLLISAFYAGTAYKLLQSTRNPISGLQAQTYQLDSRRRAAKLVLFLVIIFVICQLPSHIFLNWFYYHPNAQHDDGLFWHWFRIVGFFLYFSNSCINPVVLFCCSGAFRKQCNQHVRRICKNRWTRCN